MPNTRILWNTPKGQREFRNAECLPLSTLNTALCSFTKEILHDLSIHSGGKWWRSKSRHCTTSRKVAGSIPDGVILEYFINIILPTTLWPRVDSACNRNDYQEYLLGV